MQQARGTSRPTPAMVRSSMAAFLISAVLGLAFPALAADSFDVGIDNFGRINDNYYRGAQPDQAEFARLKQLGIKTVIDLQEDGLREERQWVRDAGMQYFNIRLSSRHPASPEETEHFLKLVNDPDNWPVYVHCAGGRHRTGEMTAIYRITHDSWTADQAYGEMKKFKYYSIGGHGSLRDHVYDYFRDHQAALAVQEEIGPARPSSAGPESTTSIDNPAAAATTSTGTPK